MKQRRRTFSPSTYAAIIERQNGRCACGCHEALGEDPRAFDFDHIVPLWLGGKDEPENLQALKPKHHSPKTSKEAGQRAKIARIQERDGLHKRRLNARDKAMMKMIERSAS